MSFDDIRFPVAISCGSTGGPERRTDVVITASGREERNARWANSRRRYDAGFGVKSLDDIHAVVAFFEERRGKLYAFRWKDHADFKSCAASASISAIDQIIGTGDGTTTSFQLSKKYGSGTRAYQRDINAPVVGTILIAVNGALSTQYTLNSSTGIITFNLANIPAIGAVITSGFEFDVPVRFDTDSISINLAHFAGGEIPHIPMVEVRP